MKKISKEKVIIFLLALNFLFTGIVLAVVLINNSGVHTDKQEQYVLFIGTNDKDTNTQLLSADECQRIVEQVCLQYVSGFTVIPSSGVWSDSDGTIFKEYTLICCINGANEADVNSISDILLKELNQSSILIQHQNVDFCFYDGK